MPDVCYSWCLLITTSVTLQPISVKCGTFPHHPLWSFGIAVIILQLQVLSPCCLLYCCALGLYLQFVASKYCVNLKSSVQRNSHLFICIIGSSESWIAIYSFKFMDHRPSYFTSSLDHFWRNRLNNCDLCLWTKI
jgi:hypothetical protein